MSTYTSFSYHFIFSTKYREPMIEQPWRKRLYDYFGGCVRGLGGVLLDINGTADHVHMLTGLRATHCVADFLREVKKGTQSWIGRTIGMPAFKWQEGYAGFSVSGRECDELRRYIDAQEEHHRVKTFREEYEEFLRAYGIEFDERYLL